MANPTSIFGRYGSVGPDVFNSLKSAVVSARTPKSFFLLGTTPASGSVYGEFGLIGRDLFTRVFFGSAIFTSRALTRQAILGPTIAGTVTGQSLLTLDWVQDAQPFVWYPAVPPSLMSLDWVKDGQPFSTNDIDAVYSAKTSFHFVASTPPLPVAFQVAYVSTTLSFVANATMPESNIVVAESDLFFACFSVLNPPNVQFGNAVLSINASSSMAMQVVNLASAALAFNANTTLTGNFVARVTTTLAINCNSTINSKIVNIGKSAFQIDANTSLSGFSRNVKPCEEPTMVTGLTSNLPYGLWQTNPDAIFTWNPVFTCDKTPTGSSLVNGYYWSMDKNPTTVPWYTDTFTQVSNAEVHLDDGFHGTGSWWFHVSAVNWTGIGPAAHYNVRYDNPPRPPGASGMFIDGLDSLIGMPLVAYAPPTPHILSWTISLDLNQSDSLVYGVQIAPSPAFAVNPSTGLTEIVFGAESIPSTSYPLATTLNPGRYYWRVHAFDGSQYSDWSSVAHFDVNNPPNAPFDLSVLQTG